jgi:ataxia telangiectasia mutated family protein
LFNSYYPNNWSNTDCREYFKKTTSDNLHDRHDRFIKIMDNFPPVFRFFFLENFADVTQWVTSRLAYTRSVAVNSIIGYILGKIINMNERINYI